jgi:mannose-6-phosphate isomerase-like protein (cupin superfamily)
MAIVKLADVPVVLTEYGRWQPLNGPLEVSGFGVNVFNADVGEEFDLAHDESESNQQELYVVIGGRAGVTIDGVEHEAAVGTIISVPDPAIVRSLRALEDGTRVVCIGAAPGTGDEGYGDWIVPA